MCGSARVKFWSRILVSIITLILWPGLRGNTIKKCRTSQMALFAVLYCSLFLRKSVKTHWLGLRSNHFVLLSSISVLHLGNAGGILTCASILTATRYSILNSAYKAEDAFLITKRSWNSREPIIRKILTAK